MRIVIAFMLLSLISCSSNKKDKDSKPVNVDSKIAMRIDDLAGDWVNLKYLNSIQKTKSPKISQNVGDFTYVSFSSDTAFISFGFHEGLNFKVKTDKPNSFFCVGYDNDTIRMIVSNDTMIIKHKATRDIYIKYQMSIPNDEFGIRLLNKEIFSGDYDIVDSPGQSISFSENGKINGFMDFSSYFVSSDYCDAGCQFDIIYLRRRPEDRFKYTWDFLKDTLKIYDLDCLTYDSIDDMCIETKKGKLLYRLIKKQLPLKSSNPQ